ncbi:hypothetical protein KA005_35630 [bacterium]|nr:hypothetical protein [bacterium]
MIALRRKIWPLAISVGLILLVACSEESPTGPALDPLTGRWLGTYTSPVAGSSEANSLSITVQAGGVAVGTALYFYTYSQNQHAESLFLDLEVTPDGQLSGTGTWYFAIIGVGYYSGFGEVTGSLDAELLTGSGRLLIEEEEGFLEIDWEVVKGGS